MFSVQRNAEAVSRPGEFSALRSLVMASSLLKTTSAIQPKNMMELKIARRNKTTVQASGLVGRSERLVPALFTKFIVNPFLT